jgi:thiol-disulfide isomerase/thioredoxin
MGALVVSLFRGEDRVSTDWDVAVTQVGGSPLAQLPDEGADPAVGKVAPTLRGTDRSNGTVLAPTTGKPTVVLFIAHWCPHCRREVPIVQRWIDTGSKPAGVDFVAVATAMNQSRPNYPTSRWLAREGWSPPIIADADDQAAKAYGLSAYPFWVVVAADGTIVRRVPGELTAPQLDALFASARRAP